MILGTGIYLEKFRENTSFYKDSFSFLEIQDFIMPINIDTLKEEILKKYSTLLNDYQGSIVIHGPYIDLKVTSFDPLVKGVFVKRARQVLSIAQKLNAQYIVFHSDYEKQSHDVKDYNNFFLKESISVWKALIDDFQAADIIALIENVKDPDGLLINSILDEINSPYLGACLDIGHAHAFGNVPLEHWVHSYGDHLKYIHLSDNHGLEDEHLPLGKGSIHFPTFFRELSKLNSTPVMTFEVFGGIDVERRNLEYIATLI